MMQNNIGKLFKNAIGRRYKNHRVIDETIKATGLTNKNVIRNPT
jgi:hypothetical protein